MTKLYLIAGFAILALLAVIYQQGVQSGETHALLASTEARMDSVKRDLDNAKADLSRAHVQSAKDSLALTKSRSQVARVTASTDSATADLRHALAAAQSDTTAEQLSHSLAVIQERVDTLVAHHEVERQAWAADTAKSNALILALRGEIAAHNTLDAGRQRENAILAERVKLLSKKAPLLQRWGEKVALVSIGYVAGRIAP